MGTLNFLNKLIIRCKYHDEGCHLMSTYENVAHLKEHEENYCHKGPQSMQKSLVKEITDGHAKDIRELKETHKKSLDSQALGQETIIVQQEDDINHMRTKLQNMVAEQERLKTTLSDIASNHATTLKTIQILAS